MANEEMPAQRDPRGDSVASPGLGGKTRIVLIALAVLMVAEIYSISRIAAVGKTIQAQDAKTRKDLTAQFNEQLSTKLLSLEHENQQQLEALKAELDEASRHLGAQRGELRRARAMVLNSSQSTPARWTT